MMPAETRDNIIGRFRRHVDDMRPKASAAERAVLDDCLQEARWQRSLPLAAATLFGAGWLVRAGRVGGAAARWMGGWPVVAGAASLAYYTGQLSFIFSRGCEDRFLRDAPESEIAVEIRNHRQQVELSRQAVPAGSFSRLLHELGNNSQHRLLEGAFAQTWNGMRCGLTTPVCDVR